MIRKIVASAVLLAAFYGSFVFVFSVTDREPPIVYEDAKALSTTVEVGKPIELEFRVFRKRICDQVVKRILTDSAGTRHSISAYTVGIQSLAGRETYTRKITVPSAVAIGAASYQVTITYNCSMTQKLFGLPIEVVSPPINFEVLPSTSQNPQPMVSDSSPERDG